MELFPRVQFFFLLIGGVTIFLNTEGMIWFFFWGGGGRLVFCTSLLSFLDGSCADVTICKVPLTLVWFGGFFLFFFTFLY